MKTEFRDVFDGERYGCWHLPRNLSVCPAKPHFWKNGSISSSRLTGGLSTWSGAESTLDKGEFTAKQLGAYEFVEMGFGRARQERGVIPLAVSKDSLLPQSHPRDRHVCSGGCRHMTVLGHEVEHRVDKGLDKTDSVGELAWWRDG
jgi:hypothetical protein